VSSSKLWFRLALREIANNKRFSTLFCANLAIGMIGFLVLDSFKSSIQRNLSSRSRSLIAADVVVSATRPFTDQEIEKLNSSIPPGSESNREISFVSMVSNESTSRLVDVRAVESSFPLYGTLEMRRSGAVSADTQNEDIHQGPNIWVAPELLIQMGTDLGQNLKLGTNDFLITDVIENDPSSSAASFAFAPRVLTSLENVKSTGLIDKGSRIRHIVAIRTPPGTNTLDLETRLKETFSSTKEIRIRSHDSASEDMGRMLQGLNDYLGLIALVALFLASVGATYLFRSFMAKRAKDIAILLSLGATHNEARAVYILQLLLLGAIAGALTLGVTSVLLPLLPGVLAPFLSETVTISLGLRGIVVALVMGAGGSILFCLPLLARFGELKPAALFQEMAQPKLEFSPRVILSWIPGLIIYWMLAVWQSQSVLVGSIFVGSFLGAGAVLALTSLALLQIKFHLSLIKSWPARLAFLNLSRERISSVSCFMAIGLGALLLNLIPQIRTTIESEILQPPGNNIPSLFLFDIQDDQVDSLKTFLASKGVKIENPSPLVRARLEKINEEPVSAVSESSIAGTREREREERFRTRMNNLSSRMTISSSERIVEGVPFSGPFDWNSGKPAEMSVEMRWADRIGVKLGDTMTFDIQGVELVGKIVNVRRVRWTSFQPNFFVTFPDGVLNDAPKIWLASIPEIPLEEGARLQTAIVREFPNISIVDVRQSVKRILVVVDQMATAITTMAWLSLLAGAAVLYSIANHQAQRRRKETALLKIFGASFAKVQTATLSEFVTLGFLASAFGGLISILVSWIIAKVIFDSWWQLEWHIPLYAGAAVTFICTLTGWLATRSSLNTKPIDLLSAKLT
jgi:putative ABC transport system permease protein